MKIKKINNEFILEAEMIPVIIRECCKKFDAKYYIEEFQTGNGIPDIVFAKDIQKKTYEKMDYEAYYLASELMKNKIIKLDNNIIKIDKYKELKKYLIKNRYIKKIDKNVFQKEKEITPLIGEIIAIEAKLSDWKNGFYQALRYKYFAHESYLAISESKIKNINLELFKANGIGLLAVNEKEVKIIIKAQKESPINMASCLYSSQNIYETISNISSLKSANAISSSHS